MVRRHFETFAALERQMNAARQLRAEILGGAICVACVRVLGLIRRSLLRIAARTPRRA